MRFDEIERIVQDMSDRMIDAGVSREAVNRLAKDAQIAAIKDLIETHEDMRFLDLFDLCAKEELAQRKGVTPRRLYQMREAALNRLSKKNCRKTSETTSQEAA